MMSAKLRKAKEFLKIVGDERKQVRIRIAHLHLALSEIVEYLERAEISKE